MPPPLATVNNNKHAKSMKTEIPDPSTVIDNSNQPHPGLIFDSGTRNTFPLLTSSQRGAQAKLNARFITKDGKAFFSADLSRSQLAKTLIGPRVALPTS
tara:strand:- start:77 stop:373 length:297 start_codon:yes stop_codon:yes gene_type:complete